MYKKNYVCVLKVVIRFLTLINIFYLKYLTELNFMLVKKPSRRYSINLTTLLTLKLPTKHYSPLSFLVLSNKAMANLDRTFSQSKWLTNCTMSLLFIEQNVLTDARHDFFEKLSPLTLYGVPLLKHFCVYQIKCIFPVFDTNVSSTLNRLKQWFSYFLKAVYTKLMENINYAHQTVKNS